MARPSAEARIGAQSSDFRAVTLLLFLAALAQRKGFPRRGSAGHGPSPFGFQTLAEGDRDPRLDPIQVGRLWGVLPAALAPGVRGPALWDGVAGHSVKSRVPWTCMCPGLYGSPGPPSQPATLARGPGPAGVDGSL